MIFFIYYFIFIQSTFPAERIVGGPGDGSPKHHSSAGGLPNSVRSGG